VARGYLSVTKHEDRGRTAHAVLRRHLGRVVDVDLADPKDAGGRGRELLHDRLEGFARPTPGRPEIQEEGLLRLQDLFFEVRIVDGENVLVAHAILGIQR